MGNHTYKVGDLVRVKSKEFFLNHPEYDPKGNCVEFGLIFIPDMFKYCGKLAKIIQIESDLELNSRYYLKFINNVGKSELSNCIVEPYDYTWNTWMIESVNKLKLELI